MEQAKKWLNGELRIPINVLFDRILIPQLGPVRAFTCSGKIDCYGIPHKETTCYMSIQHICVNTLRDKKDSYKCDLARMMIKELVNRGYNTRINGYMVCAKDPWLTEFYNRSGLFTTSLFRGRQYELRRPISRL